MYQQSYDESILLDHDCKRMLRRVSRQLIIQEVKEKLSETNIDKNNSKNNLNLYKFVLNLFGCN
jgi:hypothetical protein